MKTKQHKPVSVGYDGRPVPTIAREEVIREAKRMQCAKGIRQMVMRDRLATIGIHVAQY